MMKLVCALLLSASVALPCLAGEPEQNLLTIEFSRHPSITAHVNGSCDAVIAAALATPPRWPKDMPEPPLRAYCVPAHGLFSRCSYLIEGSADARAAGCP